MQINRIIRVLAGAMLAATLATAAAAVARAAGPRSYALAIPVVSRVQEGAVGVGISCLAVFSGRSGREGDAGSQMSLRKARELLQDGRHGLSLGQIPQHDPKQHPCPR